MTTTYDQSTVTYDQSSLTYQGLPTQFDGVAFVVEMAFGYGPLDTSPVWQPVTPYVRDIRIDRGRRSEYISQSPGTLLLTLDNRSRRFDPDYTSGPHYNQLVPMVPVRVQVTYDGTTYTLFRGFVQGWPSAYQTANTDAQANVTALDATRVLANITLPTDPFTDYLTARNAAQYASYWPFQFENETYADPFDPSTSQPIQTSSVDVAGIQNAATVKGYTTTQYTGIPAAISVWIVRETGKPIRKQIVAGGAESITPNYRTLLDLDIRDDVIYVGVGTTSTYRLTSSTGQYVDRNNTLTHVVATQTALYVNGVQVATWSLSTGKFSGFKNGGNPVVVDEIYSDDRTGRIAHLSVWYNTGPSAADIQAEYVQGSVAYGGELSSARLTRVLDDASWPAAWRDIETGDQSVGRYTPVGIATARYLPQIDNAEQGALFVNRDGDIELRSRTTAATANIVALFDDEGIDAPFSDITVDGNTVDSIVNTVEATYAYGTVTSQDATSVAAYGESLSRLDVRLIDTAADATTIADVLVAKSKDPRTRVTRLDIPVRRDPATIVPLVAPLDLADDVAVSFTPTGVGDPLWRAVRVQGIRHNISLEDWRVSLYLAPGPVNTNGPLVVLDDDTYGKLDSGNKLG